jgi:hypothetical protein
VSLFLAYLGIFGPVAVVFLAIGWAARGLLERGHKRRCPGRRKISDTEVQAAASGIPAEWAAIWQDVRDEMEDG